MQPTIITSALTAALLLPGLASAQELYFEDATARLPADPAANGKDTLDVDFADVDGDGDLDLFVVDGSASAAAFPNKLFTNDGAGHFTDVTATALPPAVANSTEVDFADIDGDGDLDAVVANLGPNQLLVNDGAGHFTDASAQLPQAAPPGPPGFAVPFPPFFIEISAKARFADVDGDGDPDLVIANENPFPFGPPGDLNRLLLNDGAGTFTEGVGRLPLAVNQSAGFVAGDLDGDGDVDLIEVNIGDNRVFINDGLGFFTDETAARLGAGSRSTRKAVLGDVDGDGDLDLFSGNSRNEQNRLFVNDGTGRFAEVTATHLPARLDTTTDVDLVDLDGDGDLDAYITNVGDFVGGHGFLGDSNRILLNDGGGRFTDATFPRGDLRAGRSTNAEFGDIDGDGDLDLAIANSGGVDQPGLPPPDGEDRLYVNRSCASEPRACLAFAGAGLTAELGAVDPDPAAGQMTGRSLRGNQARQRVLQRVAARIVASAGHAPFFVSQARLRRIERRVDGDASPPDWIVGEIADRILALARFGLGALP